MHPFEKSLKAVLYIFYFDSNNSIVFRFAKFQNCTKSTFYHFVENFLVLHTTRSNRWLGEMAFHSLEKFSKDTSLTQVVCLISKYVSSYCAFIVDLHFCKID